MHQLAQSEVGAVSPRPQARSHDRRVWLIRRWGLGREEARGFHIVDAVPDARPMPRLLGRISVRGMASRSAEPE